MFFLLSRSLFFPTFFRDLSNKILQNSESLSPPRRRYTSGVREVVVSCTISKFADPTSTRLVPPLTWLTSSGSRVKVLHSRDEVLNLAKDSTSLSRKSTNNYNIESNIVQSSVLEISVSRERIDKTLSLLRMNGFQKEDISRLFDKGPWILAFDLSSSLPKLFTDFRTELQLNQTQAVHIISHCPFLLAQYCQFKGRDVSTTARALIEVGYSSNSLIEDIMRFPSVLAAPPDRIKGWASLLEIYGVATMPGTFGKMLKRAPFMFYLDPPILFDLDTISDRYQLPLEENDAHNEPQQLPLSPSPSLPLWQEHDQQTLLQLNEQSPNTQDEVSSLENININKSIERTNNDIIDNSPKSSTKHQHTHAHDEAIHILNTLMSFQITDIDKIVRTQPNILLERECEILQRLNFIFNLFVNSAPTNQMSSNSNTNSKSNSNSVDNLPQSNTNNNIDKNNNKNNKIRKTNPRNNAPQSSSYNSITSINNNPAASSSSGSSMASSSSSSISTSTSSPIIDEAALQTIVKNFNSLLLAYPTILSIPHKKLLEVGTVLQSFGFQRQHIVQLIRKQPSVFQIDVYDLQIIVSFLRYYCSFRKVSKCLSVYLSICLTVSFFLSLFVHYFGICYTCKKKKVKTNYICNLYIIYTYFISYIIYI